MTNGSPERHARSRVGLPRRGGGHAEDALLHTVPGEEVHLRDMRHFKALEKLMLAAEGKSRGGKQPGEGGEGGEGGKGGPLIAGPVWTEEELGTVPHTHVPVHGILDRVAWAVVRGNLLVIDLVTGFWMGTLTEAKACQRIRLTNSIGILPLLAAGMAQQLRSSLGWERDSGGSMQSLIASDNNRMHIVVANQLNKPSLALRVWLTVLQIVSVTMYFFAYLLSPRSCHRVVGYLMEDEVRMCNRILEAMNAPGAGQGRAGTVEEWKRRPAPSAARAYWHLPDHATMETVILAMRADVAYHRDVNHAHADHPPQAHTVHPLILDLSVGAAGKQ